EQRFELTRPLATRDSRRQRPFRRHWIEQQARLPSAEQFGIDFGEDLGIEERPMLGPAREIDAIALAKRIEAVRRTRMPAARQGQSIDDALEADRWETEGGEFGIDEAHV